MLYTEQYLIFFFFYLSPYTTWSFINLKSIYGFPIILFELMY